jgi:hypothetical protein
LYNTFATQNVLKQGATLSPLIFNFALGYAINDVQGNQNKPKGTHQLLFYADVNHGEYYNEKQRRLISL